MTRLIALSVLLASAFLAFVAAFPAESRKELAEPNPSLAFSTVVGQQTFINKGLVAFGLIPSNFRESTGQYNLHDTGDTLGGIGSAIALKRGSFKAARDGSFTGTLVVQPDRGFNVDETINYQGRQHQIDFVLKPYYGTSNLSFNDSQSTLKLNYKSTLLYKDRLPLIALANPVEPIPNKTFSHVSLDAEGLVLNADGTFWVSDEYGPYIHHFDHAGNLLQTLQPPDAILPRINGTLNFTSVTDPDTGRVGNQGFEGLTLDESTQTLWALLQSATVQDGGDSSTTLVSPD
ncbi:esterase-like activity of phytase-domain-containing protein [Irpex lacteus]|nr:esterase-like activity of phytase-domain-containing protein [Irpex lacteus]